MISKEKLWLTCLIASLLPCVFAIKTHCRIDNVTKIEWDTFPYEKCDYIYYPPIGLNTRGSITNINGSPGKFGRTYIIPVLVYFSVTYVFTIFQTSEKRS